MPTAEHCRTMAEEADRLADIVSYTRDKLRLRQQATSWRVKAQALDAEDRHVIADETFPPRWRSWLSRRRG